MVNILHHKKQAGAAAAFLGVNGGYCAADGGGNGGVVNLLINTLQFRLLHRHAVHGNFAAFYAVGIGFQLLVRGVFRHIQLLFGVFVADFCLVIGLFQLFQGGLVAKGSFIGHFCGVYLGPGQGEVGFGVGHYIFLI